MIALAAVVVAAPSSRAAAQTLRGRVIDEAGSVAIAGAIVSLLSERGDPVRSVLTNGGGAFVISNAPAGRYRLRVEMIGRRSVESEAFDVTAGEDPPARTLQMPVQPITLDGIDVSTAQRCSSGRDAARDTYLVWEEAEKALRATALTSEQPLYRFRIGLFHRELDPRRGSVVSETAEEREWVTSDPFNSLPPAEIERSGYVRLERGETMIYGPNTDLLLSNEFQRTHCFALRRDRDRPGVIGLTFEPVAGRELPEIEGVLWIDVASAELRTLEFSYRNLPGTLMRGEYTGFAEFRRLEEGTWIIRGWRLRSPTLEEAAEVRSIERVPGDGPSR